MSEPQKKKSVKSKKKSRYNRQNYFFSNSPVDRNPGQTQAQWNQRIKKMFNKNNTYIKVRARMGSKMPLLPKYNKSTIIGRRSAKRGNKPPKFLKVFDNPSKSPPKKKSIRKTNL